MAVNAALKLYAIEVMIGKASELPDAGTLLGASTSDPYCVCQVRGKPNTRFKTPVVNNSCNPVWNHSDVVEDFEEGDTLQFVVYNGDGTRMYGEDEVLGWVDVDTHTHFPQGFAGELKLNVGAGRKSVLTVSVQPRDWLTAPEDEGHVAAVRALVEAGTNLWPLKPSQPVLAPPESGFAVRGTSGMGRLLGMPCVSHGAVVRGTWPIERMIVIHPHGVGQIVWDLLSTFCILCDLFQMPFSVAFDGEVAAFQLLSLGTATFWTYDIFRSCLCGYYRDGIIEMRINRIAMKYLKTWFVPDFILVSLDWFGLAVAMNGTQMVSKLARVLRISRVFRALSILRIARLMRRIDTVSYGVGSEIMRAVGFVAVCMLVMLVGCHLLACGFYSLGLETTPQGTPGWVVRYEVLDQGVFYAYMTSFHWAFTQFMPASSGINPGNEYERVYVLLVDILGFVCFSFFVSNVQMQLQGLKKRSSDRKKRNELLRRFFTDHDISLALSRTIFTYLNCQAEALKRRKLPYGEIPALKTLPKEMQIRLASELYQTKVQWHPFFLGLAEVDMACFARLCHAAMTELVIEGSEVVFVRGNQAHSMYFVAGGTSLYKRPYLSHTIAVGAWASEAVLWLPSWVHRGDLCTLGAASIVQISSADFAAVVFSPQASPMRQAYIQTYAAAFVREGGHENEILNQTDVWSSADRLSDLVSDTLHWSANLVRSKEVETLYHAS